MLGKPKREMVVGGMLTALALVGGGLWARDGFPAGGEDSGRSATKVAGGYSRDKFGAGFLDTDDNGCTQRDDALAAALTDETLDGCKPLSGTLLSPYTGKTIQYVREAHSTVDGDHLVPLHWAWLHGADSWSMERRVVFANDAANIVMVDSSSNRSKGDSGPSAWMPPNVAYRCTYATNFEAVAVKYQLTVPAADQEVINNAC